MSKPNGFQTWLSQRDPQQQKEITSGIQSAGSIRQAYRWVSKKGFAGGYDSLKNWVNSKQLTSVDSLATTCSQVERILEQAGDSDNPIALAMGLCTRLNVLCASLTSILERHQWIEAGETQLNTRDALKLVQTLPALSRAANGGLIELFKLQGDLTREELMLALFAEIQIDANSVLKEDPQFIPLLKMILNVTKARLELSPGRLLGVEGVVQM